jgi:hypothetical protein
VDGVTTTVDVGVLAVVFGAAAGALVPLTGCAHPASPSSATPATAAATARDVEMDGIGQVPSAGGSRSVRRGDHGECYIPRD